MRFVQPFRQNVAADEKCRDRGIEYISQPFDGVDAGPSILQAKIGDDQVWLVAIKQPQSSGYKFRPSTPRRSARSTRPFAALARERPDALFVAPDALFVSRGVQFATLTARARIPTVYSIRDPVEAGGLMSYGTNFADMFHQVGVYTGSILKGAKPADLPVLQSTKFEFVINLQTARALGIDVPPGVLSIADEVIE